MGPLSITSHNLAVDLPADVQDKVRDAKETAQATIHEAKQQLHKGAETLHNRAGETTQQVKDLTDQAVAKLPEPVVGRIAQLMAVVRRRPLPAAAVALAVLVVLRRLLRRNR